MMYIKSRIHFVRFFLQYSIRRLFRLNWNLDRFGFVQVRCIIKLSRFFGVNSRAEKMGSKPFLNIAYKGSTTLVST